jgi:hypothetical protein
VHNCSDLGPSLAPLQRGVRILGAAEGVVHVVRSALASDPEALLLSLECRNAFNTVSRAAILEAVATSAPSVMPFLRWAYGGPSRIFIRGAPHDTDHIYATSGAKQGDPLGPLLVVLALIGPLRTVAAAHPEAHIVAFFDDVNVVGPADSAVRAFDRLTTEALSVRLTPSLTECAVYGRNTDVARAATAELSIAHHEHGEVVAGTPIGSEYFVAKFFQQRIQHMRAQLDLLMSLRALLTRQD